ncbi:hypothetical protein MN116_000005 [Schistosoma mekongi]|uniref:Ig-like domain-containing protein n=1 Tax=Schistosoma mekongi TaxID=38744 RepID=A0AAE1ZHZ4_SCHME|nr:hypothetical protein MN116_000005 [Schistosoma mekongi]
MGCNHVVDYYIFKDSSCLEYVSDTRRNLNCILCLISVISDSLLQYNVRESYVCKFLNFFESNKHHCNIVSRSEKLLQKFMMTMLGVNYEELFSDFQCFNLVKKVLHCLFSLASHKLILLYLSYTYHKIISTVEKGGNCLYEMKLFCFFLDEYATVNPQLTDVNENYIFALINVILPYLNVSSLFCLSSLLKHLPEKCLDSVKVHFQKVVDVVLRNKSNDVVEAGLDCLLQLSICNRNFIDVCKFREFSVVLRALLNSHCGQIKETTVKFIGHLLNTFKGDATKLICTSGVIELLFDNISLQSAYCSDVLKCLESMSPEAELMSSSSVPYGVDRIVKIMSSREKCNTELLLKLMNIINNFIVYYDGALDFFISPPTFGVFLITMADIVENCTTELGLLGIICIVNIFKFERQTEVIPYKELNKFLKSIEHIAKKQTYKLENPKRSKNLNVISDLDKEREETSSFLLSALLSLLQQIHTCLYVNKTTQAKTEFQTETECSLTYIFFAVVMNIVFQLIMKHDSIENVLSLLEITTMYAHGVCSNITENEITNICGRRFENLKNFKSQVSTVLKNKIRRSFILLLPLFYRICFMIGDDNIRKPLFLSGYHTINDRRPEVDVGFYTGSFSREILLTLITANSSIFSRTDIHCLVSGKSLTNLLRKDELGMWISTLIRGFKYFTSLDFEYLEKCMELCVGEKEFMAVSASAISVICILINRNFEQTKVSQILQFVECENYGVNLLWYHAFIPKRILKRLIQFPTKVGVNFFRLVPVLITIEFLVTYICLPNFWSIFENSMIKDEYNSGSNILSLALLDCLQPVHTVVLLRTPGFTAYLNSSNPTWIKITQKIILQCHTDELLIEEQVFSLIPTTYILLSNTWAVWYNNLLDLNNSDVLRRLLVTFEKQIIILKKKGESTETGYSLIQREQLALYICECLLTMPSNLPGSFLEVFASKYDLKYVYVKMLKIICMFLHEVFLHSQFIIIVAQQIIRFLANEQLDPTSLLRNDLLQIMLHFLVYSDNNTHVQIVKLLCSEIKSWERSIFYFSEETSKCPTAIRLKTHSDEYQITTVELDCILGIGASVNLCAKHLPSNYDIVDSISRLLFMKPETILAVLSHNSATSGSLFIETSALICLLESFNGPASHLLWPDIHMNSNEDYFCELFMCLNTKIMNIRHKFTQEVSIEVYGCLVKHMYTSNKKQSYINLFLLTSPWCSIILEHLRTDSLVNNDGKFPSPYLAFINVLLSTNCSAIFSSISKTQLRNLLLAYIHGENMHDSVTRNYLKSISQKIASRDYEVLDSRERLCLEVMTASDNLQPTVGISHRFQLFYKEIFCL